MDFIEAKFRQNRLRMTPQRIAVYEEISKSRKHPNAEVIFRKVRKKYINISFDTVNRTLITFAEIGFIREVEGYGEPKRYDSNTNSHHHLRCLKCGNITDFNNEEYDNLQIPDKGVNGFIITGKRVVLEGYCSKCRRKS